MVAMASTGPGPNSGGGDGGSADDPAPAHNPNSPLPKGARSKIISQPATAPFLIGGSLSSHSLPTLDASPTQLYLDRLAPLSIPELKAEKQRLAWVVTQQLIRMADQGEINGLVIQDGACPGTLSNAFLQFKGSGKVITGAVNVSSAGSLLRFTQDPSSVVSFVDQNGSKMRNFFAGQWTLINDLPAEFILGVNGNLSAKSGHGRVQVYIGNRFGKNVEGTFQLTTTGTTQYPDVWRAQQILATIAALDFVGHWIDTTRAQKLCLPGPMTELPAPVQNARPELLADITGVKQANDSMWRYLRAIIKDSKHFGISIGESFTGGAVASLLHSLPYTSRYIDSSIVWYDKSFKHAFGVRDDLLGAEQIASLATARDCATKLLQNAHHQGGNSQTAIATTGRACRLGGHPDDLFVAISSKSGDSYSEITARMVVTATQNVPLAPFAYDRNELTRQLGVSVSLLLLGGSLSQHYPKYRQALLPHLNRFGNLIGKFGDLSLHN